MCRRCGWGLRVLRYERNSGQVAQPWRRLVASAGAERPPARGRGGGVLGRCDCARRAVLWPLDVRAGRVRAGGLPGSQRADSRSRSYASRRADSARPGSRTGRGAPRAYASFLRVSGGGHVAHPARRAVGGGRAGDGRGPGPDARRGPGVRGGSLARGHWSADARDAGVPCGAAQPGGPCGRGRDGRVRPVRGRGQVWSAGVAGGGRDHRRAGGGARALPGVPADPARGPVADPVARG